VYQRQLIQTHIAVQIWTDSDSIVQTAVTWSLDHQKGCSKIFLESLRKVLQLYYNY
jgi:hypothetical protein